MLSLTIDEKTRSSRLQTGQLPVGSFSSALAFSLSLHLTGYILYCGLMLFVVFYFLYKLVGSVRFQSSGSGASSACCRRLFGVSLCWT